MPSKTNLLHGVVHLHKIVQRGPIRLRLGSRGLGLSYRLTSGLRISVGPKGTRLYLFGHPIRLF